MTAVAAGPRQQFRAWSSSTTRAYSWRERDQWLRPVKPLGFNFERNFNGIPGAVRARVPRPCPCRPPRTERRPPAQDYWVAPASNDTIDQVAKLFDEWGWKVTVYDGAE